MAKEYRPYESESMLHTVSYINRKFDVWMYLWGTLNPDKLLSCCISADTMVLSTPTPGAPNDCQKHATLNFLPADYVMVHVMSGIKEDMVTMEIKAYATLHGMLNCLLLWGLLILLQ